MPEESQFNTRTVRAILEIGGTSVPVNSVHLVHRIDELPYAEINIQLDNKTTGVVNLDIGKFQKMCRLFQEYIFNSYRIRPNAHLNIMDGNEHVLTFNGFIGAPELMLVNGQVNIKIGMVHAKAALQAFNAQIYSHTAKYVIPFMVDAFAVKDSEGKPIPDVSEAAKRMADLYPHSVSLRILAIVEYMVKNTYLDCSPLHPTEFDALPIHLLNKKSIELVREVLLGSERSSSIPGIGSADFFEENLRMGLWSAQVNAPNFWASLAAYAGMFLFQVNADWQGNMWLEYIRTLDDPENRVIRVPMEEISFDCAHLFEAPLIQVMVLGGPMDLYIYSGAFGTDQGESLNKPTTSSGGETLSTEKLVSTGEQWTRRSCLSKYPRKVKRDAVGCFYTLQAPNWISPDVTLDTYMNQLRKGRDPVKNRFQAAPDLSKEERETMQKANKTRLTVLEYMAKQFFQSLYLGKTSARLTVPYDVRPCVGRTYRVNDMARSPIFVGFLREIHHNLELNGEAGASANTTMVFTHIRMIGARLDQLLKTVILSDEAPLSVPGFFDSTYKEFENAPIIDFNLNQPPDTLRTIS